MKSREERFWSKVQKTETCWIWTASKNPKGYGYFGDDGRKIVLAHRFSWNLHNGPVPDGLRVLHRCDNPPCVRPDHLFVGTDADNLQDSFSKGRRNEVPTLIREAFRRFTDEEVRHIRELYDSQKHWPRNVSRPYSLRGLAQLFNVTYSEIAHIVKHRAYKTLD